jgi:pimeloyl-ACP methyl ester carboxylesterase
MSDIPDALCINASQSLSRFNHPLLKQLSKAQSIARWDYTQSLDEPCSLEGALTLLHAYLGRCDRPLHVFGHGVSGLIGLLYARRYPERVRSLTLLSVGVHPAVTWQTHYYVHRHLLNCSQSFVLAQVVTNLFGCQSKSMTQRLMSVLEQDLDTSPSPHSLYHRPTIAPGGTSVPLFICRGEYDVVIDPNAFYQWQSHLKVGDRLWECADGRHFFHYTHPDIVAEQTLNFWQSVDFWQSASPKLQAEHRYPAFNE